MIDLNTLDTLGKCRQTMNQALLSSKKMDYCTPKAFFEKLNAEFHFVLDAAATEKSAKCPKYYTPETNGLSKSWNIGGGSILQPSIWTRDWEMGGESLSRAKKRGYSRSFDSVQDRYSLLPRLHLWKSRN